MPFFGSYVPLEYFMYAAIGFCVAWLMALMCFPAVHHRAQRLLRKQYEEAPLSIREMQAEKDQIRAGFATATRDLELSIEKLKGKTVAHATELARKSQIIERLKRELDAISEALQDSTTREREARAELLEARREFETIHSEISDFGERERGLVSDLRETRRELTLKNSALDAAEQEVAAIKTEIARLAPLLAASQLSRQTETVPLAPAPAPMAPRHPILAQLNDDGITRAWTDIDAAAKRAEPRPIQPLNDGPPIRRPLNNQTLRAAYAPYMKPAS